MRAADYYGISCDYLLGRSMARDGSAVPTRRIPSEDANRNNEKQMVCEAVGLLFDLVQESGSRKLPEELTRYFAIPIYKAFRYLYMADPKSIDAVFRTRVDQFDSLCDAQAKLYELRIRATAAREQLNGMEHEEFELPNLAPAELVRRYPQAAQSLLTLLQIISDAIMQLNSHERKT